MRGGGEMREHEGERRQRRRIEGNVSDFRREDF
jgi:hypothetical protein